MPERHGLPLIVKFALLAFCGLLVLAAIGLIAEAVGGSSDEPDLAARAASCETTHGGGPFEHLRYPYTALPVRPDYSALAIEPPAKFADTFDAREVSRDATDGDSTLLGTALYIGYGDDPSFRDTFFASTLTNARDAGIEPQLTTVHGHEVYTYTRPTKNPNNSVLGSTPCGALLVLANSDHTAAALWRRLVEPPVEP